MSISSAIPPVITVELPTEPNVPPLKVLLLSPKASPHLASRPLSPTSSAVSPIVSPEESIIQPGINVYDLPKELDGTLSKIKRIGGGGYSDVHYGVWTRPNTEPVFVAMKIIRRVHLDTGAEEQENQARFEKRIKREVVVWTTAKHENILEFCGFKIVDGDPILVSSWCENGNLRQYIKNNPNLTAAIKLGLLRDAAQGLAHLHSLEPPIVHGDMKPDNIMVTNDVRGVLCDFGISRVMAGLGMHTGLTTAGQGAGTAGFQAKELYEEHSRPTPMSDIYAFGGVILATMTGKTPFYKKASRSAAAVVLAINRGDTAQPGDHLELPKSDPLWALLKKCWDAKPDRRPCMAEIIAELVAGIQRPSPDSANPS